MLWTQHPELIRQQLAEEAQRLGGIPRLPRPVRQVATRSQRGRMLWTQHPELFRQQLAEEAQRLGGVPRPPRRADPRPSDAQPTGPDALDPAPGALQAAARGGGAAPRRDPPPPQSSARD